MRRWMHRWVINENLLRVYKHYRSPNLQKFWFGKPSIPAPPLETEYFNKAKLLSSVVRRKDDYRPAASIKKEAVLPLDNCSEYSTIQFAISLLRDKDWVTMGGSVSIKLGEYETSIHDLSPDSWFDVRLDNHKNTDSLTIKTDTPLVMTMPRGINRYVTAKDKGNARHVILLVLDAWATSIADRSHPFTSEKTCTPNIDRFFSRGLKAMNGVSSGQWTLPVVASLFTGLCVGKHRMTDPHIWQKFDQDRRTLPEYFQQNGYHTLCASVASRVNPAFGHIRGFDRFLYHFAEPGYSYQTYDPAIWVQEMIGHLESHHGDKTFSYFQFPDTHPSWDIGPDTRHFYLGRRGSTSANIKKMFKTPNYKDLDVAEQAAQVYLLRIAELDRMFGSIFEYIERHFGDDALVVVTSDHGLRMPWDKEINKDYGPLLTDDCVNIPLYMRGNGVPERTYNELCLPNVDIPLMLLQLAGIKPDTNEFDGINLLDDKKRREVVISEEIYGGIYEIAARGYGHTLFLKYKINDTDCKFLSKEPIYSGLYPIGTNTYLPEGNLSKDKPDVSKKLYEASLSHVSKHGFI